MALVAEIVGIVRHWLGPAKCEAAKRSEYRHHDRSDWVDMFERVQGEPSLQTRRRVTQIVSHVAMRDLMDDDREYEEDDRKYGEHASFELHIANYIKYDTMASQLLIWPKYVQ